jgi:hypothetical protein
MRKNMRKLVLALAAVTALGALRSTAATLNDLGAVNGSAIGDTFQATGSSVTFNYNYLSNDINNNDFAFYTLRPVSSPTAPGIIPFASSISSIAPGTVQPTVTPGNTNAEQGIFSFLNSGTGKETGNQSLTINGLTPGTNYVLSIGVANAGNTLNSSGLVLDNLPGPTLNPANGGFESGTLLGYTLPTPNPNGGDESVQFTNFNPPSGQFAGFLTTLGQNGFGTAPFNAATDANNLGTFVGVPNATGVPLPAAVLLAPFGMAVAGGFARKLRRKA